MADLPNVAGGVPPAHHSTDELLIGVVEAARRLCISKRFLQDLTKQGVVPCVRMGRRVLYCPASIRTALAQREREGQTGGT